MNSDRAPAVAGAFYPANPAILRQQVESLMAKAGDHPIPHLKALVAPHAGYRYSGPIAASAYAALGEQATRIKRVLMLGPTHRMPIRGLACPTATRFLTPLGPVPVDQQALDSLALLPQVRRFDPPFNGEHCLEVQLPFLQVLLADFSLIPLLVGDATSSEVAEVIERLWNDVQTLVVVSSDLSHYLDYDTASRLDRDTTHAIEELALERLDHHRACGATPLGGLLLAARRRGLKAQTLDLRSSGDTAGPRDQVVGYGGYAVS